MTKPARRDAAVCAPTTVARWEFPLMERIVLPGRARILGLKIARGRLYAVTRSRVYCLGPVKRTVARDRARRGGGA